MLQQIQVTRDAGKTGYAGAKFCAPAACAENCNFFSLLESKRAGTQDQGPLLKYPSRKTIYSKGDAANYRYRVVEGAVRLSRILMDGHRQVLDLLLPGETFGMEMTTEHSATAEAIGDVVLLRCPSACVAHQLATRTGAASRMNAILSNGVASAQDHVAMLSHQGAIQRVALFLLHFQETQKGSTIELPVGRQDMADYLGLTVETTCRSLTEMKNKGIISICGRRGIEIRNRDALEAIAEGDED